MVVLKPRNNRRLMRVFTPIFYLDQLDRNFLPDRLSLRHMPHTPSNAPPTVTSMFSPAKDLKLEIIEGIDEIVDELNQVDDQIAGYTLEHIHSSEIILTHTSSVTVQKFLLKAAAKRKLTVIHAEAFPNDHEDTHATVTGNPKDDQEDDLTTEHFHKPLTAAGIIVVLIPESAVFAIISRVNKAILGTDVVLANGGLVTATQKLPNLQACTAHPLSFCLKYTS